MLSPGKYKSSAGTYDIGITEGEVAIRLKINKTVGRSRVKVGEEKKIILDSIVKRNDKNIMTYDDKHFKLIKISQQEGK